MTMKLHGGADSSISKMSALTMSGHFVCQFTLAYACGSVCRRVKLKEGADWSS